MGDQQTLLQFLSTPVPCVPLQEETKAQKPRNTVSDSFSASDIGGVSVWTAFNYENITKQFSHFLARLLDDSPVTVPHRIGPKNAVRCESGIVDALVIMVYLRTNIGLDKAWNMSTGMVDQAGLNNVNISFGDRIGVMFSDNGDSEVRSIGEIKCSWKWDPSWRTQRRFSAYEIQFRQVLSQLHFYLNEKGLKYGYVLTDSHLVVVKRLGEKFGKVEVSEAMAFSDSGDGKLPVVLGLWALHMMASQDGWKAPRLEKPRQSSEEDDHSSDSDFEGDSF